MFTKTNKISNKRENLHNYIEGFDIYNSDFLLKLSNPELEKERLSYEIRTYQYRPDLIAKDFYGSSDYEGILILQASRTLATYTKGSILRLLPKTIIDNLLSNL